MYIILIALLLIPRIAFAEASTDEQVKSFHKLIKTEEQARELATNTGVVYVGMPKEDLYKVYVKELQKGYYKDGNEEWITFSEWKTEEPEDRGVRRLTSFFV